MDSPLGVLILDSGTHASARYPAFKSAEPNLYAPVLVSASGSFDAADRLAVTD